MGGRTIVNIPGNGNSFAGSIGYRWWFWRYLEWTVGVLDEGKSDLINRHGLNTQLFLAKAFFDDRLALGAGFGYYLAEDRLSNSIRVDFLSEMVSVTASYRLSRHWDIRGTWDRFITDYDRDSDVFLGGFGYRF